MGQCNLGENNSGISVWKQKSLFPLTVELQNSVRSNAVSSNVTSCLKTAISDQEALEGTKWPDSQSGLDIIYD